jgi:spermidine synthase
MDPHQELKNIQVGPVGGPYRWLYVLFFCSGFPALLYQIVWQRALFTIYGVNIESVTVVVSVFMLGLGLGSLIGGQVSKMQRLPLLAVFGLIELGIGAYGMISLPMFHYVARLTSGAQPLQTGLITFVLLLLPTVLMGSTLPILVAYLVRLSGNVGRSVSVLYCVNTMGSAVACFAAAAVTMPYLGESGSVRLGAAINATIGLGALAAHFRSNKRDTAGAPQGGPEEGAESRLTPVAGMSISVALIVSALSGFIALGYEILWYRGYSYALASRAPVFALLLGFYLAGIALGSLASRALCRRITDYPRGKLLRLISILVLFANIAAFLLLPAASFLNRLRYGFGIPIVTVATVLLGALFPVICHAAVPPNYRAGQGLSHLYLSNIIGSTLGSFIVGYILMDHWSIGLINNSLGLAGVTLGASLLIASASNRRQLAVYIAGCVLLALLMQVTTPLLFRNLYERLGNQEGTYQRIIETKSGVIAVDQHNTVYGGGAYDGKFNISLITDSNGIFRPYSLSFFHPRPRRVLMIGLSSGSWAQVIVNHPDVESLTIVEINPGYLQLIREHADISNVLDNPKIVIAIDDGRRWLTRNRDEKFDVIVQNTTWAWRAHVSNLLSIEYLELVRRHLAAEGVFFFNTTNYPEALLTAVSAYPYAVKIGSCIAVSDHPLRLDINRWEKIMLEYRINGAPVVHLEDPADQRRLSEVKSLYQTADNAEMLRRANAGHKLITDDNMGIEWIELKWYIETLLNRRHQQRQGVH